jgi:hypothetical protein
MLSCRALAVALPQRAARCASFAPAAQLGFTPPTPLRRLPALLPALGAARCVPLAAARSHQLATAAAPERDAVAEEPPAPPPAPAADAAPTFAALGVRTVSHGDAATLALPLIADGLLRAGRARCPRRWCSSSPRRG